jgi:hypothetical protein
MPKQRSSTRRQSSKQRSSTRRQSKSMRRVLTVSGKVPPPVSKSGVPITDGLADQLAEEAEHGYDLRRGRRVGRRSLAGGSGYSPRLNVRTTPELYERTAARASREGKSISQLAREALEHYME